MFKAYIVHISDTLLYEGEAKSVLLPGVVGEFEVQEKHGAIVSLLCRGAILIRGSESKEIPIEQGLVRFDGQKLFAVVE